MPHSCVATRNSSSEGMPNGKGRREWRKSDTGTGSVSASSPPTLLPQRHAWKRNLQSKKRTSIGNKGATALCTNMMFTPSTTRVHTHTHTHTCLQFCLSLTSSLFMAALYLDQNLTHHRGCHTDLDGRMDGWKKMGKWVNEFLFS